MATSDAGAGLGEIGEKCFGSAFERAIDQRADRHRDRSRSSPLRPDLFEVPPGLAGFGRKAAPETKLDQRRELGRRFEIDAAAVAAVAAGRTALGNVLLATPRHDAVAAVAGGHRDRRFVDELHRADCSPQKEKGPNGPRSRSARRDAQAAGTNVDVLAVAPAAELDGAVDQREKRVIAPDADVRRRDRTACRAGGR